MGGIVGIKESKDRTHLDEKIRRWMLEAIKHRSQESRVYINKDGSIFGIGYLNSVDQKRVVACDQSQKIWVFLDGDVFNALNGDGLNGKEFSDAEIILQLYQRKGGNFAENIDGSYSIAIWDGNQDKLLLIRDRVGYKPLFYFVFKNVIVFASEIKAILASNLYEKSINLRALNNFLSYGYVPNPDTLFELIRQVKPGHMLICKDGEILEKPYWRFRYREDEEGKEEKYYVNKFVDIFETSVSRRIKRYPDAGAFLSGGLDTSAVVAMMHKLKQEPFKVFSAGFREEQYNEIEDAKIVANRFGLDLNTIIIEFDKDFPSLLEKIVWHHDSPFADTSAVPSYFAAKLAREHVDVVLTGDFPDQLIGGSGHHVMALKRSREDHFYYHLLRNKGLNKAVRRLNWSAGGTSVLDKAKRAIYRETFPLDEQRILLSMPVPPLLKRCLYGPELLEISQKYDALNVARSIYSEVKEEDLLNRLLYFDILSYAPDDLMVKVERMTAAHGLNAISPFHDLELVEFIASVPSHLKIKGTTRKYIMREALRPLLPEHTLNKKKQGFAMPIGEWLVTKMPDYVRDVLLDSKGLNRGYFNKKFMTKMVGDFLAGKTDYASGNEATIISLITLELWHRIFIDK